MNCPHCGQELDQGAQFCGNCGQPLATAMAPAAVVLPGAAAPLPAPPAVVAPSPAPIAVPPQPTPPPVAASAAIVAAGNPHLNGRATAALVLGVMSLIAWILPLVGLPVSIVGLVMGLMGRRSQQHGLAIAGIILASLGLVASLINAALGWQDDQPVPDQAVGQVQSRRLETACFSVQMQSGYLDQTQSEQCSVEASDGQSTFTLKTIDAPNVTADNLNESAHFDLQLIKAKVDGGAITSEGPARFAGEQAYRAVLTAGEQGTAVVYYVYHPRGYRVGDKTIRVFAFVFDTPGQNLEPMAELERSWKWREAG